jgi:hypothetical protein
VKTVKSEKSEKSVNSIGMRGLALTGAALCAVGWLFLSGSPVAGQASGYKAPRTPDGKPNLNGIWQANNTANYDLQGHAARPSPVLAMGAAGAIPGGLGVVDGEEIPYKPEALAKKKQNAEKWLTLDPEVKCYLPGVPRATYMPFPFQIVQTPKAILMAYEFASASRVIDMSGQPVEAPVDSWMGYSSGKWEGETLVVDVTGFNDSTWFDRAGNFHSEQLHVVERYTPISRDALQYEATIEDPKTFTRPWKISMPLYRRLEKNAALLEFKCVEFVEELMYGHLRKQPSK